MIIEKCVTSSPTWRQDVQVFHLTQNMRMRVESDTLFKTFLLHLGSGHPDLIKQEGPFKGLTLLPAQTILRDNQDLITETFSSDPYDESSFSTRAILCPTNEQSFEINQKVLDIVPGVEREYFSVDRMEERGDLDEAAREAIPSEFLNSLTPSGMPRHKIVLKVGSVVMLLRNMDKKRGNQTYRPSFV